MPDIYLNEKYLTPIAGQPPMAVHSDQINFADFGDNEALKRASDVLGSMWEKFNNLRELRNTRNPLENQAQQSHKVRAALSKAEHEWLQKWDGAKATLKSEQRRVESQLESQANLKPIDKNHNAIVGTFQGMKPEQRQKTISDLIEQNDGPSLSTLIEAPLFTTGLTAEQRDSIKLRLYAKINPEGLALRDQIAKSLDKMESASTASISYFGKLREGTDRYDKRVNEANAIAAKAGSSFAA